MVVGCIVLDLIFCGFVGRGGGFGGFDFVLYGISLLYMVNICILCISCFYF